MGTETAQIKMELAHALGCDFEDVKEKAEQEVLRWHGGARSLREGAKAVEKLLGHVSKDVHESKISVEAGDYAQKYVRRAAEVLRNLATQADGMSQRMVGRADGLKAVVEITKRLHDSEEKKLRALEDYDEEEAAEEAKKVATEQPEGKEAPPRARPPGGRPAPSIAALRRETETSAGSDSE